MAILRVLFRRGSSCRLRMMATLNILACSFVIIMTLLTTFIGYFVIIPHIYKDDDAMVAINHAVITYLFINVCGNFVLCVCVDTSTARASSTTTTAPRTKDSPSTRTVFRTENSPSIKTVSRTENSLSIKTVSRTENSPSRTASTESSTGRTGGSCKGRDKKDLKKGSAPDQKTSSLASSSHLHADNKRMDDSSHHSNPPSKSSHFSQHAGVNRVSQQQEKQARSCGVSVDNDNVQQLPSKCKTSKIPHKPVVAKSFVVGGKEKASAESPLRSHKCVLCEKQVLRRDHHCFFMTVCIGYHNHKHFIFFCLYMMIGALYGVILSARYMYILYKVRFQGPQTFVLLLVQMVDNIVFKQLVPAPFFCLLVYELYVCLAVGLTAAGFLYWHIAITVNGQTTHEASSGDTRFRRRSVKHNVRDVLGCCWPLLFLLPLPLPQDRDGRHYRLSATGNSRYSEAHSETRSHHQGETVTLRSKGNTGNDDVDESDVKTGKVDDACAKVKARVRERRRKGKG